MPATTVLPDVERSTEWDADSLYEIINGKRVEVPRMGMMAVLVASYLAEVLGLHATRNRLGFVLVEALFRLAAVSRSRRPDLSFVSFDRWPYAAFPEDDPAELDLAPNLAIEVISPTNTSIEIEDKIQDYFRSGVELVWVVYPRHRRAYVYDSPTRTRILSDKDALDGGNVLKGFKLPLSELFNALSKPSK